MEYRKNNFVLYQGDCNDIISQLNGSVDMILTNVIDIVIMSVAAGGYCAEALGLGKWLYCGGKPCRKKQAAEQDTKLVND